MRGRVVSDMGCCDLSSWDLIEKSANELNEGFTGNPILIEILYKMITTIDSPYQRRVFFALARKNLIESLDLSDWYSSRKFTDQSDKEKEWCDKAPHPSCSHNSHLSREG
tara:strand:- start:3960 stop:4289 length:330 start_codon:yes stop_codon:yes gene_type:complete